MSRNRELRQWIEYLNRAELPVFANTARKLVAMSSDSDCSAQDLAAVILNDSAMTAKVLRLASSVIYNPGGNRIDTVSYAIMLLGFDAVRNLALSIALIDTVLQGRAHDNAMHILMLSLHAAVQAKELAQAAQLRNNEEVFIGAMLYRLGHIVFWCFPQGHASTLLKAQEDMNSHDEAQRKVLGFTLDELTLALSEEWNLGDVVAAALVGKESGVAHAPIVRLAHNIAEAISKGWNYPKLKNFTSDYAGMAHCRLDKAEQGLHDNASIAVKTLHDCGFRDVSAIIPAVRRVEAEPAPVHEEEPPAQLYLRITQELTQMMCQSRELNSVLASVMEGIYRALPVDFVVMFLYDKRGNCWREKMALGKRPDELSANMLLPLDAEQESSKTAVYHWKRKQKDLVPLVKSGDYFWGDIRVEQRAIGAWLAVSHDKGNAKNKKLTENDFLSFKQLCDLATIAFRLAQNDRRN
jgi:HD-like signal output (HDOD) protein